MWEQVIYETDVEGLEEAARAFGIVKEGLSKRPMEDRMKEVLEAIAASFDEYVPRWHGDLASSFEDLIVMASSPEEDVVEGYWGSDLDPYAPQQERGTDPYWPNINNLVEWAEEHDVSAYIVARAIAGEGRGPGGLRAQQYLQRSLADNEGLIYRLFDNFVAMVIEDGEEAYYA